MTTTTPVFKLTPILPPPPELPHWIRPMLFLAAAYNVLWGAVVVLFPAWMFHLLHIPTPHPIELWQCIGMIVGCYGVGYALAGVHPDRYWPVVLVGLLGKTFGPIGFALALWQGVFPLQFGINIIFNDLIWWFPFLLTLVAVYQRFQTTHQQRIHTLKQEQQQVLEQFNHPHSPLPLLQASENQPLLLVLLRHSGCIYCSTQLALLAKALPQLTALGVQPVIVTQSTESEQLQARLNAVQLDTLPVLHDPAQLLYASLGLPRGRLGQLFGWRVWLEGVKATLQGHAQLHTLEGDGFQLSGVALLHRGQVLAVRPDTDAADTTDFVGFSQQALT